MRNSLYAFFMFLLCITILGPVQAEELVMYDDFSSQSKLINPDKWIGEEASDSRIIRESIRKIMGEALKLKIVGYGNNDSLEGYGLGTNSLIHSNGEFVNDIMATFRVKEFSVVGCSNPKYGIGYEFARARLTAPLFNVGEGTPTPGSSVDDIYAQFRVIGTPNDSKDLKVLALVQKCLDASCNSTNNLLSHDFGTVRVNKDVTLRIKWDKDENSITFYRDSQSKVFKYDMDDEKLAEVAWRKRLDVSVGLPNCIDINRSSATITAIVDNVYVNESAIIIK